MLCVVFRNKPTHHLIAKTPEGVYAINKKTYDGHKNVGAVRLHLFPPRWCSANQTLFPVRLSLKPRPLPYPRREAQYHSPHRTAHTHTQDAANR